MELICPNCAHPLVSENSFFCVFCGKKVRDVLVSATDQEDKEINEPPKTAKTIKLSAKKTNSLPVFIILISLLFLLTAIYIKFGKNLPFFRRAEIISPVENSAEIRSLDLSNEEIKLTSGNFFIKPYSETVPISASSLIMLNDFSSFYKNYLIDRNKIDFNAVFGINLEEAATFIDDSFAICVNGNAWAYLFKVKNVEFVAEKISNIKSGKVGNLNFSLIDDFLVVSNDSSLIEDIKSSQKGTSLSLSKDALFIEATKNLSVEGEALVFSRDLNVLKSKINEIMKIDVSNIVGTSVFVAKKNGIGATLEF